MKNGGPLFPIESTEKASLRSARRISGRRFSPFEKRREATTGNASGASQARKRRDAETTILGSVS